MSADSGGLKRPWYFEAGHGQYTNEWTLSHVLWGALLYRWTGSLAATMILHTAYEVIEQGLFPSESRDVSIENHIGDSIAALAGAFIAMQVAKHGVRNGNQDRIE